MEGRSGKRVEVTGARERCSRRKEGGRGGSRGDRQSVLLKTYVTAKVPSSLHEQIRGCRSGVEPAATLRPTSSPWGGLPPVKGQMQPLPAGFRPSDSHMELTRGFRALRLT